MQKFAVFSAAKKDRAGKIKAKVDVFNDLIVEELADWLARHPKTKILSQELRVDSKGLFIFVIWYDE